MKPVAPRRDNGFCLRPTPARRAKGLPIPGRPEIGPGQAGPVLRNPTDVNGRCDDGQAMDTGPQVFSSIRIDRNEARMRAGPGPFFCRDRVPAWVRIGLPCGRGQPHEARLDPRTTKCAPRWPAEPARLTRRRTESEPGARVRLRGGNGSTGTRRPRPPVRPPVQDGGAHAARGPRGNHERSGPRRGIAPPCAGAVASQSRHAPTARVTAWLLSPSQGGMTAPNPPAGPPAATSSR